MITDCSHQLLTGLCVLDMTSGTSGSYASKYFCSAGATVVKAVSDNYRFSAFRDSNKSILHYPDAKAKYEAFSSLLAENCWDLILEDSHDAELRSKLNEKHYAKLTEHAVRISIQLPKETDVDEEQALQALAGWRNTTGDPKRDPLTIGGYPVCCLIGIHSATAGLLALLERKWLKKGRAVYVDAITIAVSALEGAYSQFAETGAIRKRAGNRHHNLAPMAIFKSSNHYAFIGAPADEQWDLLTRWIGIESETRWKTNDGRMEHYSELEPIISQWAQTMTTDELVETGQTFRMPFGKVQTVHQLDACPQLQHRQFFNYENSEKKIQPPWKVAAYPFIDSSHCKKSNFQSWDKLRVLDLTNMWSGPYCTRIFADQGAEVIKIEAPHRLDGIRSEQENRASFFRELNRNKKGITLDLSTKEGQGKLMELIECSDVLIENFSPRVMRNFGLTPDVLRQNNKELIIMSLSAFGQTGPYCNYVGYGPTLEAMSGISSLTHYEDSIPWLPGFSISDIGAGVHGAFILTAALFAKDQHAAAFTIDVSQYETAIQYTGDYIIEGTQSAMPAEPLQDQTVAQIAALENIHTCCDLKGSKTVGVPWRSEGWSTVPLSAAPLVGEHNKRILNSPIT